MRFDQVLYDVTHNGLRVNDFGRIFVSPIVSFWISGCMSRLVYNSFLEYDHADEQYAIMTTTMLSGATDLLSALLGAFSWILSVIRQQATPQQNHEHNQ